MGIFKSELEAKLGTGVLTDHPHRFGATVYSFSVAGKDSVSTWRRLRQSAPGLGFWPVIFGEPKNVERICEVLGTPDAENPAETIQLAGKVDIQAFFRGRAEEFSGEGSHGDWPKDAEGMMEFTIPRNILQSDQFHESVVLGLVPASHSSEVPAVLSFGS